MRVGEGGGVEEGYGCGFVEGAVGEGEGGGYCVGKGGWLVGIEGGDGGRTDLRPKTPDPMIRIDDGGGFGGECIAGKLCKLEDACVLNLEMGWLAYRLIAARDAGLASITCSFGSCKFSRTISLLIQYMN